MDRDRFFLRVALSLLVRFIYVSGTFMPVADSFIACLIASGGTHTFAGLCVARLFQGVGACMYSVLCGLIPYANPAAATFSTMVGGVISDIYHAEERNTPMALFSAAALFGTGLAPLLSGAVIYHTTWRWIFYSHAIVSAAVVVYMYFFFHETRGSVILSRKAEVLNQYYEKLEAAGHHGVIVADNKEEAGEKQVRRLRWKVKSDEERASLFDMISLSCYRPFRKFFLPELELIASNKT